MMKLLKAFLPHLAVALLLGLVVLIILDGHNPLMAFLTSDASKVYMLVMCAAGVAVCVEYMAQNRK